MIIPYLLRSFLFTPYLHTTKGNLLQIIFHFIGSFLPLSNHLFSIRFLFLLYYLISILIVLFTTMSELHFQNDLNDAYDLVLSKAKKGKATCKDLLAFYEVFCFSFLLLINQTTLGQSLRWRSLRCCSEEDSNWISFRRDQRAEHLQNCLGRRQKECISPHPISNPPTIDHLPDSRTLSICQDHSWGNHPQSQQPPHRAESQQEADGGQREESQVVFVSRFPFTHLGSIRRPRRTLSRLARPTLPKARESTLQWLDSRPSRLRAFLWMTEYFSLRSPIS